MSTNNGDAIHYTVTLKKTEAQKDGDSLGIQLVRERENNLWMVDMVAEGSTSDRNNVRKGDFLVQINDEDILRAELGEIKAKFKEMPLTLTFRREKRRKSRSALQTDDIPILFEAHTATNIKNVQFLTSQDPFVLVYPIPSKKYISQTKYDCSGDTNPTWHCALGSQMLLFADPNDAALKVEIWNKNSLVPDQLIGSTEVNLPGPGQHDKHSMNELDTGGEIECSVVAVVGANPLYRNANVKKPKGAGRAAVLEILSCDSLPDVQWLGNQDPYVVATAWPSGYSRCQTVHSESGGIRPRWTSKQNNTLVVVIAEKDTAVRLQVFNANMFYDDLIDSVEIPIDVRADENSHSTHEWVEMKRGGKLEFILSYVTNPLAEFSPRPTSNCSTPDTLTPQSAPDWEGFESLDGEKPRENPQIQSILDNIKLFEKDGLTPSTEATTSGTKQNELLNQAFLLTAIQNTDLSSLSSTKKAREEDMSVSKARSFLLASLEGDTKAKLTPVAKAEQDKMQESAARTFLMAQIRAQNEGSDIVDEEEAVRSFLFKTIQVSQTNPEDETEEQKLNRAAARAFLQESRKQAGDSNSEVSENDDHVRSFMLAAIAEDQTQNLQKTNNNITDTGARSFLLASLNGEQNKTKLRKIARTSHVARNIIMQAIESDRQPELKPVSEAQQKVRSLASREFLLNAITGNNSSKLTKVETAQDAAMQKAMLHHAIQSIPEKYTRANKSIRPEQTASQSRDMMLSGISENNATKLKHVDDPVVQFHMTEDNNAN